ncbi:MAG: hypothetical protein QOI13_2518 [Paraburkholderia sp.]|nr:hypothetical protein [Paraburkholderia sp.]
MKDGVRTQNVTSELGLFSELNSTMITHQIATRLHTIKLLRTILIGLLGIFFVGCVPVGTNSGVAYFTIFDAIDMWSRPPSAAERRRREADAARGKKLAQSVIDAIERDDIATYERRLKSCGNWCSTNGVPWIEWVEMAAFRGSMRVLAFQLAGMSSESKLALLNSRLRYSSANFSCNDPTPKESQEDAVVLSLAKSNGVTPDNISMWLAVKNCQSQALQYWLSQGMSPPENWEAAKSHVSAPGITTSTPMPACQGERHDRIVSALRAAGGILR